MSTNDEAMPVGSPAARDLRRGRYRHADDPDLGPDPGTVVLVDERAPPAGEGPARCGCPAVARADDRPGRGDLGQLGVREITTRPAADRHLAREAVGVE